jgi:outer membrane protein with beta-barrel domain
MEERAMSLKRLLTALVILGACAVPAHAGLFVGGSVGDATINDEDSGFSFDANDTGYKVFAGFTLFKFFALEASYVDLGTPEDTIAGTEISVDATGWDVYAVGILPLGKHFEIFGKAGIIVWDAETSVTGSADESDDGNDPAYGAGVAFKFGEHIALRLEYERFDISDVDKVEMASVGAEFRF